MTEIVRRPGGSLVRGIQVGPARDLASVTLAPIPPWGNIDTVPPEVMSAVKRQGLMPRDLFVGGSYEPIVVPGSGGGLVEEAGGWLVGSDALVQFDAYRPHRAGAPAGTGWTVTGVRHEFAEPTKPRHAMVAQDSAAAGGAGGSGGGTTVEMPLELDIASVLPATARLKLLSVAAPTLADSYMRQHDNIPGLSFVEVSAVAVNSTVCVAVLGRLEVQAHRSDTSETVRRRLAAEPWRLGIVRGLFG